MQIYQLFGKAKIKYIFANIGIADMGLIKVVCDFSYVLFIGATVVDAVNKVELFFICLGLSGMKYALFVVK